VGLERGPLNLVSATEKVIDRKVAAPESATLTTWHPLSANVGLPTSGGRSVGVVGSRTQATKFSLVFSLRFSMNNQTKNGA
jgi:hypothetical protein